MLKKIFNPKRKRQDPGRHNTSKITMDPVSTAILSRHFSPLSSRAKSPSDLLDIVGYPFISNQFTQSSPELILYSTPLQLTDNNNMQDEEQVMSPQRQRLTIRNNTTPPLVSSPRTNHDLLLLETSREDKTLVEEERRKEREEQEQQQEEEDTDDKWNVTHARTLQLDETKREVYLLHQKLLEFEHEREAWKQRLQGYIQREEQMRQIIHENQAQINQLKSIYHKPTRHNSYRTVSTHSSWPTDEEEEDYYQPTRYYNNKRRYNSYYTNSYYNQPYYYYD